MRASPVRLLGLALLFGSFVAGCGRSPERQAATSEAPLDGEADVDAVPWQTGDDVGYGIARKDTGNPVGQGVFIAYAGYGIGLESAERWATALYRTRLHDRGVGHIFAVQGPDVPSYANLEIGNSRIASELPGLIAGGSPYVLVVGHSSGSFVAHELLRQLSEGFDPGDATAGRVVYFDLDGGGDGLTDAAMGRLRRAYFVGGGMSATGTPSPNHGAMQWLGGAWARLGGYLEVDANGSGCAAGAQWCVHISLINTVPHDPWGGGPVDYDDFDGRAPCTAYLDMVGADVGF